MNFFNITPNGYSNIMNQTGFPHNINSNIFINNNYFLNNEINYKERPELLSIIGIGDCIVDIITEINSQIINLYHLQNDQTKYTDENTKHIFNELEKMPLVHYIIGGSVLNILRTLSYNLNVNVALNINQNNLINGDLNMNLIKKYQITILGCVGEDVYKDKIIYSLNKSQITPLLKITKEKTSRCGACLYDKNPFLISEINASKNLDKEFISSHIDEILKHEILLIEGYYLQYQFELCCKLCELFKKEGNKLIILTLSPISLNQNLFERFICIANYADIIFSSKSQAEEFSCSKGEIDNKKIFTKIFQNLSDNNKRLLVIKNGQEAGYCAKYNYQEKHLEFILACFPQQIKDEQIVDKIGLEDAFFAGFLSEYMKGNSLYLCLKKGNEMANIVLKNPGCTFEKKK